jgi:pyruvate/2-oxoglutarate dehydrogenase complex dihydrolipoamide acyltransferase (E2) component
MPPAGRTLFTDWSCFGQSAASIYGGPKIALIRALDRQGMPMQTVPNPQDVDPNEIGIVPENEELVGYVYKRVVREVLARIDQRLAEIEKQAAPDASEDSVFRTTSTANGRPSLLRRWGARAAIGALLSIAVIGGAAAWYFSDADGPRTLVARWVPLFGSSSSAPQEGQSGAKDGQDMPIDLSPRGVQTTATDGAAPQPASLPTSPPDNDMRAAAAGSGELAPLMQKLTSEIETLGQGIDRLRMSQDQLGRDNALAMQQLQAGQDQLTRLIKPTAQNVQVQPKPAAAPRRTATRPPRNPAPAPSLLFRRAT